MAHSCRESLYSKNRLFASRSKINPGYRGLTAGEDTAQTCGSVCVPGEQEIHSFGQVLEDQHVTGQLLVA